MWKEVRGKRPGMKPQTAGRSLHYGIFSDSANGLRARTLLLYALLAAANVGAWLWALAAFRGHPVELGTAVLAYTFGLRHAVDADHIAAIDNVTRKLMQEGRRPAAAGFFFSLGHSTIVWAGSIVIALSAAAFRDDIEAFKAIGGVTGTLISATCLLAVAIMNIVILAGTYEIFKRVKAGGDYGQEDLDLLSGQGGVLARVFRPVFRIISRSWHMYPLGLLFGLGFDTATEIGLLGMSAAGASHGMSFWPILVFPALFTAGMSLVDTADSVLMLKAYGWAFDRPVRKLYYNMTMTLVSILAALIVGGLETLNLIGGKLQLEGDFWKAVGSVSENFGILGYIIIGVFAATWALSAALYHLMGYGRLDARPATAPSE